VNNFILCRFIIIIIIISGSTVFVRRTLKMFPIEKKDFPGEIQEDQLKDGQTSEHRNRQ
jgi:hypothetical protein